MSDTITKAPDLYTFGDCSEGLCTFEQIGTAKPIPEPIPEPSTEPAVHPLPDMANMTDAEIAATAVRLLREATVEVFHKVGGADWLYELARTNPKEFLKMLQRLLPQTIEATVAVQPFEIPAPIRGLSLADLKAMRSAPVGSQIIDVEFEEIKK